MLILDVENSITISIALFHANVPLLISINTTVPLSRNSTVSATYYCLYHYQKLQFRSISTAISFFLFHFAPHLGTYQQTQLRPPPLTPTRSKHSQIPGNHQIWAAPTPTNLATASKAAQKPTPTSVLHLPLQKTLCGYLQNARHVELGIRLTPFRCLE